MELKINKIPHQFFIEPNSYILELYRRNEFRQKQEELSEYLDEI
jgi:hypothetical protein